MSLTIGEQSLTVHEVADVIEVGDFADGAVSHNIGGAGVRLDDDDNERTPDEEHYINKLKRAIKRLIDKEKDGNGDD